MMYNNKIAAAIKVNGKILREFKDTVYIPFGSEYSILIKNLSAKRAIFNVYIDGDNIVPGGLVLNAGQEIDLERTIKNGNMSVGNKLKFIERTSQIEDHRGIKLEDGIVKLEYQFEKEYPKPIYSPPTTWPIGPSYNPPLTWNSYYGDPNSTVLRSSGIVHDSHRHLGVACSDVSYAASNMAVGATLSASSASITASTAAPQSETGITVAGSKSEQKFVTAKWFATEPEKHNIILKLLGETEDNKTIREPITVKAKPKCTTCGKQNKATSRYCSNCGTALVIYA